MARAKKSDRRRPPAAPAAAREAADKAISARWGVWFWVAATAAGLLLRLVLILATDGVIYPGDHDDFVRWGIQATDEGLLSLYDKPPPRHDIQAWRDGQRVVWQRAFDRICNYPPLSAYLLAVSGRLFQAVSADRLINTVTSRLVFCSWGILADFIVAGGCAALIGLLRSKAAARVAYLLALLLPPLWWDSVIWGQMDSVVLAPAMWMLYAMVRQRWLLAGLLWGLAFGLKPQAVLFVPVWALAVVVTRPFWKPLLGGILAPVTLLLASTPFLLHSGAAWLRLSYLETLFSTYADLTTLKAFNLWYLDLLISDSLDASATWLGLTKDKWGKLFLGTSLLAGFILIVWRWRRDRRALLLWSTLVLLAFVMLPTQVHERYVILVLPFLGTAAALYRRLWPGLVMLLIVTMAQLSWPAWQHVAPGQWSATRSNLIRQYALAQAEARKTPRQELPSLESVLQRHEGRYREGRRKTVHYEWMCSILALAATAWTAAAVAALRPGDNRGTSSTPLPQAARAGAPAPGPARRSTGREGTPT